MHNACFTRFPHENGTKKIIQMERIASMTKARDLYTYIQYIGPAKADPPTLKQISS